MREEQQIDNQFRDALFNAEVQPPASVWEGVRSRRKRRGMAFWSRRRGLTIVTLFVALGAGAYWALQVDREGPLATGESPTPSVAEVSRPAAPSLPNTTAQEPVSSVNASQPTVSLTEASNGPVSPITKADKQELSSDETAAQPSPVEVPKDNARIPSQPEDVTSVINVTGGMPPTAMTSMVLDPGPAMRMNGRRTPLHISDHLLAPEAAIVSPYVLPNSEWWLGVQVGWYDVRRQWSGGGTELRDALNASEAWTSTIGFGALLGRTWRSGWGFSLGAEHERSEQQFRHVERSVETDEVIQTMVVTLNTDIFFYATDTVVTQVVDEHIAEGLDRRSVIRVPVEGHWRGAARRWMYGLGAGVAAEFTRTTSSSILVEDADGNIVSVAPENSDLRKRYPAVLLGIVTADVGYLLHERWVLWASPTYMRSITSFNIGSEVFAQPERFGMRLRLSYTFNRSR